MADRPLPRGIAAPAYVEFLVRPESDVEELRRLLTPHRSYAAYALGQLQPRLFERSAWWTARGSVGQALLLHSRGGLGSALFLHGAVDGVEALLRLHPGPRHTFLTCQPHHLGSVRRHFHLSEQGSMLRLLVDRPTFQHQDGDVRRLTGAEVHQINRLYRSDGTAAFYTEQNIDDAVYYGVYDGGRLVAVAGTHVVSPENLIAVAGNVFVHPMYRGRGLGTVVTSAVTSELLASCRDVVLTVDPRNVPAVRAYRKLGYREVGRLVEAAAVRRDVGAAAFARRWIAGLRGRRFGAELVRLPA